MWSEKKSLSHPDEDENEWNESDENHTAKSDW